MSSMKDGREQTIDAVKQRARANFSSGYNCAESVVEAVFGTIETDLPPDVLRLSTGFGGGIGLHGDVCGALAGAVIAVGAVHGRCELPRDEDRETSIAESRRQLYVDPGLYRVFNQIPNWFVARYGETLCRELTAKWHGTWLCRAHALHCREIITEVAGLAARLILLSSDELASLMYGLTVEEIE